MRRDQILAALRAPEACIEGVYWNGERRDRLCDAPDARPRLLVPQPGKGLVCVARLRSFTVEGLLDAGLIKQRYEQSGIRTFVLPSVAKEP